MNNTEIKEKCLKYLIDSGFVDAYVKKLMYSTDINDLYSDYLQETWLAICEVHADKISMLYKNSVSCGDVDEFYQLRNWVSRLIYNTVHSDSSNAFKRLKKYKTNEMIQTDVQWNVYKSSIADDINITEQIRNLGDE